MLEKKYVDSEIRKLEERLTKVIKAEVELSVVAQQRQMKDLILRVICESESK